MSACAGRRTACKLLSQQDGQAWSTRPSILPQSDLALNKRVWHSCPHSTKRPLQGPAGPGNYAHPNAFTVQERKKAAVAGHVCSALTTSTRSHHNKKGQQTTLCRACPCISQRDAFENRMATTGSNSNCRMENNQAAQTVPSCSNSNLIACGAAEGYTAKTALALMEGHLPGLLLKGQQVVHTSLMLCCSCPALHAHGAAIQALAC